MSGERVIQPLNNTLRKQLWRAEKRERNTFRKSGIKIKNAETLYKYGKINDERIKKIIRLQESIRNKLTNIGETADWFDTIPDNIYRIEKGDDDIFTDDDIGKKYIEFLEFIKNKYDNEIYKNNKKITLHTIDGLDENIKVELNRRLESYINNYGDTSNEKDIEYENMVKKNM